MQLLDNMLIYILSLFISLSPYYWMLQANDEAQQLATNCQKRAIESLALVGETCCAGSPRKIEQLQQDDEKKHKMNGLAAVKVLDIETEAPSSPATDYGNCRRIFKP